MRKITLYIILFCFLSFQGGMRNLLKVPSLFIHFIEHKLENPEMTVSEFIHTHYCHNHKHTHAHNECGDLPYQTNDLPQSNFHYVHEWTTYAVTKTTDISKTFNVYYDDSYVDPEPLDFWQPPRL